MIIGGLWLPLHRVSTCREVRAIRRILNIKLLTFVASENERHLYGLPQYIFEYQKVNHFCVGSNIVSLMVCYVLRRMVLYSERAASVLVGVDVYGQINPHELLPVSLYCQWLKLAHCRRNCFFAMTTFPPQFWL